MLSPFTLVVDGQWSTWSSWSTCSPDCKHHRRRLCDNPAQENGGKYCSGTDLDTANCTGAMCKGRLSSQILVSCQTPELKQKTKEFKCIAFVAPDWTKQCELSRYAVIKFFDLNVPLEDCWRQKQRPHWNRSKAVKHGVQNKILLQKARCINAHFAFSCTAIH